MNYYSPEPGLMPASFKVNRWFRKDGTFTEFSHPDFGESAIGRVVPVDSGQYFVGF